MNNTQMAHKASALASIDFGHRRLLSCRPRHFSHCSAQAPEWFATRLILISPITTRTGSTVASPSTHPFCTGLGRKNTAAALRQARPCSARPGTDAHPAPHSLCFHPTGCAPRPRHHTRLAAKQPQPRTNALRPHGPWRIPLRPLGKLPRIRFSLHVGFVLKLPRHLC